MPVMHKYIVWFCSSQKAWICRSKESRARVTYEEQQQSTQMKVEAVGIAHIPAVEKPLHVPWTAMMLVLVAVAAVVASAPLEWSCLAVLKGSRGTGIFTLVGECRTKCACKASLTPLTPNPFYRERERQRETERERQTDRQTDRQTERQREREGGIERETERQRHTQTHTDRDTQTQRHRDTHRHTHTQQHMHLEDVVGQDRVDDCGRAGVAILCRPNERYNLHWPILDAIHNNTQKSESCILNPTNLAGCVKRCFPALSTAPPLARTPFSPLQDASFAKPTPTASSAFTVHRFPFWEIPLLRLRSSFICSAPFSLCFFVLPLNHQEDEHCAKEAQDRGRCGALPRVSSHQHDATKPRLWLVI